MILPHPYPCRVYYEDTDAGGIVYYANYLKFMERGRSEWLRALGFESSQLATEMDVMFAVAHCTLDFLAPARLDDLLTVRTVLQDARAASLLLQQSVWRGEMALMKADVTLACLNTQGRPARLPLQLRQVMQEQLEGMPA